MCRNSKIYNSQMGFFFLKNLHILNSQVAGPHLTTYEDFFRQADPRGSGSIGALEAANFLKKSALNDVTLSQVHFPVKDNTKELLKIYSSRHTSHKVDYF